MDVLVLGAGLIGTSVGLALRDHGDYRVLLGDLRPEVRDAAVARGAGEAWDGARSCDVVLVASPPTGTAGVLAEVQRLGLARTYTHVASVQSQVQREVEALGCDTSTIVGGHPLAGKEQSGPGAAARDLFRGRAWAVCPSAQSSPAAVEDVEALAEACGATPIRVGADEHDAAVALLSHLPQVASTALAALLVPATGAEESSTRSAVRTELSGTGLVDTTRLAASDPGLWTQILASNAAYVAPRLRELAGLVAGLAADLEAVGAGATERLAAVTEFLDRGNRGRAQVPVKRGERDAAFSRVGIEVDDRPGRLAALLAAAGELGVNVEDVHVDHVPGRPRGVIELLVESDAAHGLAEALATQGWAVQGS